MKTILISLLVILLSACSQEGGTEKIKSLEKELTIRDQNIVDLKNQLTLTTSVLELVVFDTPLEYEIPTGILDNPFVDKKNCAYKCLSEFKTIAKVDCIEKTDFNLWWTCRSKLVKAKSKCAVECFSPKLP